MKTITEKECSICKNMKPLSEFHKQSSRPSGYRSACKNCSNTVIRNCIKCGATFNAQRSNVAAGNGNFCSHNCSSSYCLKGENHGMWKGDTVSKAARAQGIVRNAVRYGRLVATDCELCGASMYLNRIEAHHDDYNEPLKVRWLCIPCHRSVRYMTTEYNNVLQEIV